MPLLIVLALMALPFVEIWLMILAGQHIGVALTIAALFALSVSGVFALRKAGTRKLREEVDEAVRTGSPPQGDLLNHVMLMVGGVLLLIPGFVTGAVGAALALPFTRPALRWAFLAWAERRIRTMAATSRGPVGPMRGSGFPGQGRGPGFPGPGRSTGDADGSGSGRVVPGRVIHEDNDDSTT